MKKKILTLDDLYSFYSTHQRSTNFSSKKSGYQIAVQVPATFEVNNLEDDTMLFATVRCFHVGVNRNGSNVTHIAAEKAMKTMAYKPILANFYTNPDTGVTDFTSHDMFINDDDEIEYVEKQVGCFTADEPWFEDVDGAEFVCAKCAIPRDYTKAVEVLERKGSTKTSVELLINEMSYNAKDKCLQLDDVTVHGQTLLGVNPNTGEEVQEGMKGAKVSLSDFSESNNSLFSSIDEEQTKSLIESLDRLSANLKEFNNKNILEKGGENMHDNENFDEVVKPVEGEDTVEESVEATPEGNVEEPEAVTEPEEEEAESVEEEAEAEKEEVADEEESQTEESEATESEEGEAETEEGEESEGEADDTEDDSEDADDSADFEKFSKTFELSHEDTRVGLYTLLADFEVADNEWYYIESCFDDHFVYSGMFNGKIWSQSYSKNNEDNTVKFEGERTELFRELLTASEKAELESMRANYAALVKFKETYDLNVSREEKKEVLSADCYSSIAEMSEFVELCKDENLDKYSVEEIEKEANALLGKFTAQNFSLNTKDKVEEKPVKKNFSILFAGQDRSKDENSFITGLIAAGKAKEH